MPFINPLAGNAVLPQEGTPGKALLGLSGGFYWKPGASAGAWFSYWLTKRSSWTNLKKENLL